MVDEFRLFTFVEFGVGHPPKSAPHHEISAIGRDGMLDRHRVSRPSVSI
jgi:hypothetical protein